MAALRISLSTFMLLANQTNDVLDAFYRFYERLFHFFDLHNVTYGLADVRRGSYWRMDAVHPKLRWPFRAVNVAPTSSHPSPEHPFYRCALPRADHDRVEAELRLHSTGEWPLDGCSTNENDHVNVSHSCIAMCSVRAASC